MNDRVDSSLCMQQTSDLQNKLTEKSLGVLKYEGDVLPVYQ